MLPTSVESLDPRTASKEALQKENIKYDELEDKWSIKTEDQTIYEFNPILHKWISIQLENNDITDAQKELLEKKRQKLIEMKAEKLKKQLLQKKEQKQNTSIYVTNLPLDIDLAELKQVFTKFGVLAEDLLTNKPKVKLYQDENGKFKGDALITYLKPESVSLSIQMLDDTKLRPTGEPIKVQKAEFKEKPSTENADANGESNKRQLTEEDKKVIKKKFKSLKDKTEDWVGDDDLVNPKWQRTVILKRVFTLQELKEDPYAKQDIEEDIQDGCEEIGPVDKVILFDQEEEGVVIVRFINEDSADKCIERMDGRFYGGQKLIALKYNGEQFNKSEDPAAKNKHAQNSSTDEKARLESFIEQNS